MSWKRCYQNINNVYPDVDIKSLELGLCQGFAMLYAQGVFCGEHTIFYRQAPLLFRSEWSLAGKIYPTLSKVIKAAQNIYRDNLAGASRYEEAQKYIARKRQDSPQSSDKSWRHTFLYRLPKGPFADVN